MLFFPVDEKREQKFLMLPQPDVANANGVIFSKEVLDAAIKRFYKQIDEGKALVIEGLSEKSGEVNLMSVIGGITDISFNDSSKCYEATMRLFNTPLGINIKPLFASGYKFVLGTNKITSLHDNICNDPNLVINSLSLLLPRDVGMDNDDPLII